MYINKSAMKEIVKVAEMCDKYNIRYDIKNFGNGHMHTYRRFDGKLIEYWATTGKIKGYSRMRGHNALITLLCAKP